MDKRIREYPRTDELFTGVAHTENYHSKSWIAKKLVNGFMAAVIQTAKEAGSKDVHEIGGVSSVDMLVADDGSGDATSTEAIQAGARVLRQV